MGSMREGLQLKAAVSGLTVRKRQIDRFDADFQISVSDSKLDKLRLEFGNSGLEVTGELTHRRSRVRLEQQSRA